MYKCPECNCEVHDGEEVIYRIGLTIMSGKLNNKGISTMELQEQKSHVLKPQEEHALHKACFWKRMDKHGAKGNIRLRPFAHNK